MQKLWILTICLVLFLLSFGTSVFASEPTMKELIEKDQQFNQEVKEELIKRKFKCVDPLKLTMFDAMNLLYEAKQIVVEFGGSFTNLVHCKPGTRIIVLIPEGLLNHKLNAKKPAFVYHLLEWLQPLLFHFDVRIVKGSYKSKDSLYEWLSGDILGESDRMKCEYNIDEIMSHIQ